MKQSKAKNIYVYDNLSNLDRIVLCFAEFLGTAMLVFLGCMGCVYASPIPAFQIAFTFGLAVMVAVQCFGHISGCHINPAVTLASVILGHTPVLHIPLYFLGQFLGAVGGFGLLKALSANGSFVGSSSCSPVLSPDTDIMEGIGVEFVLTFVLVMVCASLWDCRNASKDDSAAIKLGLTIVVLAVVGFSYTGAHLNPARSFGPSLLNGHWDNWFVWWVGPLLGGVAAAVVYRFVFSKEYDVIEHTPSEVLRLNEKA
ncbi:hypothetical protein WA026_000858 [Henosepilachna vigintioctopunctata]|uniref:Aquaporin n=1 Tax=Henosepilachna vigintioctopunctata TaxID=420089 RepID=A0AAW1V565_9CUCU